MRISLKTEPMAAEPGAQQQYCRRGYYEQRDQLLPIHAWEDNPKNGRCNQGFKEVLTFFLPAQEQDLCVLAPHTLITAETAPQSRPTFSDTNAGVLDQAGFVLRWIL